MLLKRFLKQSLKYLTGSLIYFFILFLVFLSIPANGETRSQGYLIIILFTSYVWVPLGLIIGFISGFILILINRKSIISLKFLIFATNLLLPLIVGVLFVSFIEAKAELIDNPMCINRITNLKPLLSITSVQTKELDRD